MSSQPSSMLINIIVSVDDIRDLADEFDVDEAVAIERAFEWAKHVEATASTIINEQFASIIKEGQP